MQSVKNMLDRFGVKVDDRRMRMKNAAAVMITGKLKNLNKPNDKIDIQVSSIGDAKSLEGGTLLLSPVSGQDGNVYVMAQGPVTVGGFSLETVGGGGVRQNYTLVGRVPGGGIVQDSWKQQYQMSPVVYLNLREPDFATITNIIGAINGQLGDSVAVAQDPSTVIVQLPQQYRTPSGTMEAIALIQGLTVTPDVPAKVVINEKTGTVVVGGNVTILPVAVAHGNLSVEVSSQPIVSQPPAFSQGQTAVIPNAQASVYEGTNPMVSIAGASTVQQVTQALNTLGLSPRDVIAVLQAIKLAGALKAELVVM
jgi:flagellar P-ring protein precursor FlgI